MLAELVYQPDKNFEDGQSCPSLVETAILHKFCGSCWTGGRRPVVRAEKQEELRGVAERSWNMVATKVTGSDEVVEWIPVSYAAQTIYTLEDRYARNGSYIRVTTVRQLRRHNSGAMRAEVAFRVRCRPFARPGPLPDIDTRLPPLVQDPLCPQQGHHPLRAATRSPEGGQVPRGERAVARGRSGPLPQLAKVRAGARPAPHSP